MSKGLCDLLNYAHFVDDGIILNKDGSFLQTYQFRGPDIQSVTADELDRLTAHFNRLMTHLDDGWLLHVDECRIPSQIYPEAQIFPSPVAALIDEERRQRYEAAGNHFENQQFLTFIWKFPTHLSKKTRHWFVEGLSNDTDQHSLTDHLFHFKNTSEQLIGLLSSELVLSKLSSPDLLSYLNTCLTGEQLAIAVPPEGCFIDVALSRAALVGGYVPRIGERSIYALTIQGYLNADTVPGLLEELGTYPLVYRWSNRFISLSESSAAREMSRHQKNWNNKVKGFSGLLKETISGKPSEKRNIDAQQMSDEVSQALTLNSQRSVRFGYWTSVVILIHKETAPLEQASQALQKYLEKNGFSCQREDVNALDAWLGSIPGHGSCNARRLFFHSLNLAHVLPLHSIWSGETVSSKSSLLPPQSPPVFYAATAGKTPFRFHLDVADVGHQVVLGPTGAGKSTYLGFLVAQFLRYPEAQIFIFDKDLSHHALTIALGGHHYPLGQENQPLFCPLADLSTQGLQMRATQFIEHLVTLQNVTLNPELRSAIHTAILALSESNHDNNRNLTVFRAQIQHRTIRDALQYYTVDGPMQLLDATMDTLQTGYLQTFEMGWLLNQKPDIYLPVLFYIFDQIENRLEVAHGQHPTLIVLEEAWLYIAHPLFAAKLKDWLKTLRKKNARVIFATQSLSDLYDPAQKSLTSVTATILESCPTKLFLPNTQPETETKLLYEKIGLNKRQIEIITQLSVPKRHYYLVTPEGNRLINLGFDSPHTLALAFIGLSKKKSQQLIACRENNPQNWVADWLISQKLEKWVGYLQCE